jgi:hypothetical protein
MTKKLTSTLTVDLIGTPNDPQEKTAIIAANQPHVSVHPANADTILFWIVGEKWNNRKES